LFKKEVSRNFFLPLFLSPHFLFKGVEQEAPYFRRLGFLLIFHYFILLLRDAIFTLSLIFSTFPMYYKFTKIKIWNQNIYSSHLVEIIKLSLLMIKSII